MAEWWRKSKEREYIFNSFFSCFWCYCSFCLPLSLSHVGSAYAAYKRTLCRVRYTKTMCSLLRLHRNNGMKRTRKNVAQTNLGSTDPDGDAIRFVYFCIFTRFLFSSYFFAFSVKSYTLSKQTVCLFFFFGREGGVLVLPLGLLYFFFFVLRFWGKTECCESDTENERIRFIWEMDFAFIIPQIFLLLRLSIFNGRYQFIKMFSV